MAWGIGSIQTSNPQFKSVRLHLLLCYVGVMVAILGTAGIAVYYWVARNLHQDLNNYLITLGKTAANTLEIVKHEYNEYENGRDADDDNRNLGNLMEHYGQNGLLSIPVNHPIHYYQGIEWFNEKKELMIKEGQLFSSWPLSENFHQDNFLLQKDGIRSIALPVFYTPPGSDTQKIAGYIRVSKSVEGLEIHLLRLRWGLCLGGLLSMGLITTGGLWLTRESLKPIKSSFQQLKQFTADASHELRSPITAIKSCLSVLQDHPERIHDSDVQKIASITSATEQMAHLVEDLLLLARMDGDIKTITLEKIPIPIDEILEDLLDITEIQAEEKQITLQSQLENDVLVLGDGEQLKRLLANLLDNALQYTSRGGIVKISLFSSSNQAIVTVEDTGIGIAVEDLPYVFNRLWRGDEARSYRLEGTGLGMAIAKTIVNAHNGEINVTSELGIGSCFRVQLPKTNKLSNN